MADGAPLLDLLLCWPFYQKRYGSAVITFLLTKTTTDNGHEQQEDKQEQSKNELR
jgi:hypothetical protein